MAGTLKWVLKRVNLSDAEFADRLSPLPDLDTQPLFEGLNSASRTKLSTPVVFQGELSNMEAEKSIIASVVLSLMWGTRSACPSNGRIWTLTWSTNGKGTKLIAETNVGSRCLQWQAKFFPVFSFNVASRKLYIYSYQRHNVSSTTHVIFCGGFAPGKMQRTAHRSLHCFRRFG